MSLTATKSSSTQTKPTQNKLLEKHLRGTGRSITSAEAMSSFGIKNLRARMWELEHAGLRVRRTKTTSGQVMYSVSARDTTGSRAFRFV